MTTKLNRKPTAGGLRGATAEPQSSAAGRQSAGDEAQRADIAAAADRIEAELVDMLRAAERADVGALRIARAAAWHSAVAEAAGACLASEGLTRSDRVHGGQVTKHPMLSVFRDYTQSAARLLAQVRDIAKADRGKVEFWP